MWKTIEPEDIINALSNCLSIPAGELLNMKGEVRGITVYFLKVYTDMSNIEIGKLFNGLSYSAVSQIKKRFSDGSLKEQATKKKIKEI